MRNEYITSVRLVLEACAQQGGASYTESRASRGNTFECFYRRPNFVRGNHAEGFPHQANAGKGMPN